MDGGDYPALKLTGLLKKVKVNGKLEAPEMSTLIYALVAAADTTGATKTKMLKDVYANQQVRFKADAPFWARRMRRLVKPSSCANDKHLWVGDNRENNAHPFVKHVKATLGEFGTRGVNFMLRNVIVWVAILEWHKKETIRVYDTMRGEASVEKWEAATARIKHINGKRDNVVEGLDQALREKVAKRAPQSGASTNLAPGGQDQSGPTVMETGIADGLNVSDDSEAEIEDEEEEQEEGGEQQQQQPNKKKERKDNCQSDGVVLILDKRKPKTPSELYEAAIEYDGIGKALWKISSLTLEVVTDWSTPTALKTNDFEDETLQHCILLCKMFEKREVPEMLMKLPLAKSIYLASRACEGRMLEDEPAAKRARSQLPAPYPDPVDSDEDA
jgi:hypothetical protein